VNYTTLGLQGLMKERGNARKAVAEEAARSVGGTVESFHFALGTTDASSSRTCLMPSLLRRSR
jgi:uncharacterized protein with GYD domain